MYGNFFFVILFASIFLLLVCTGVIYAKKKKTKTKTKKQDYYIPKGYLNKYKIKILSDQEAVGHSLIGYLLSY